MNAGLDPRLRWQQAICASDELTVSQRHVAVVLATCLRYDMTGAVSVERLVDLTGRHRQTVMHALRSLRALGWLSVVRGAARGRVTEYLAETPALFTRDGVLETAPQERDGVLETAPQERDGVLETAPLLRTKNYVRTYAAQTGDRPSMAVPSARPAPTAEDAHAAVVVEVMGALATTKLRPTSPSHAGRLRGLIRQRLEAGVTPAEVLEDARTVTTEVLDPPAMFARAVRREPWIAEPAFALPAWCGECVEESRLLEDEDGRPRRCPVCHPRSVAL